ncbi:antibiotic biosynthesis monooxygenase [Planococcus donghaensis MPA1U2]|uniref:Antibiotic biosynthesis monooxygenase n=1 Tax=Planococcus donghaensis MPA1U2 TaxID=933115 RepID=E7RDG2_9BACL|nr:putative quinol monooxygenase [Planococcus donghaensis]EGA90966.1 antibiotic biosynthesis monooxygenase [Planococcus donghaensis MPA1U2]
MNKFGLYGKFKVQAEHRETLVDILLEAALSMQSLDDCEVYLVGTAEEKPDSVYVYEVWKSVKAHLASLSLDATKLLIKRAKPIITGMERINTLQSRGGKR